MEEKYTLEGVDGNAYSVMAYVKEAMRECGKSKKEIDGYLKDAMSSDYNHLLFVSGVMLDELNEE